MSPRPPRPVLPSLPRVVIVDADRRVQQSISDLLSVSGEVSIVGRAGDVRSALREVEELDPDVLLVDPRLPDVDAGIALIRGLRRARPNLRIVLTGWQDTTGHTMGESSACYVSKGGSPEEFVTAIVAGCSARGPSPSGSSRDPALSA